MIKLALDCIMRQKNITRYELSKKTGIQYHVIDNYYKNKVIRYDSFILNRICTVLDCGIQDVIHFEKDNT